MRHTTLDSGRTQKSHFCSSGDTIHLDSFADIERIVEVWVQSGTYPLHEATLGPKFLSCGCKNSELNKRATLTMELLLTRAPIGMQKVTEPPFRLSDLCRPATCHLQAKMSTEVPYPDFVGERTPLYPDSTTPTSYPDDLRFCCQEKKRKLTIWNMDLTR